jgi:membrane protein
MAAHFRIYLTEESNWVRLWQLLKLATEGAFRHNCLSVAKGAAYSSLLSFFPVLTTIATLLVQARAESVSRTIARFLYRVVPPGTEDVVHDLFLVQGQRPKWLLVGAVILAAWAASGAMISLMEGFNTIYGVPSDRPFVRQRGVALLLVLLAAVPLFSASALIVFGTRVELAWTSWLRLRPEGANLSGWLLLAGQALRYGVAFATTVLVTALVYYVGPNRKQTLRMVFPGATLVTLLWMMATAAFAWYVRHVANYNVLYGGVGAGLALLVWMYVLAVINLFGCEFNAAYERDLSAPPDV